MKHAAFDQAAKILENRDVLVSYSCGKDSMILLDLAKRVSKSVQAFFMELVPMRHVDERLAWAEARWGVKVKRYPHWLRARFAREGVFCFHDARNPQLDINDVYAVARKEAGAELIVTGAKRGDSLWRRRTGALKFAKDDLKAPLWDWSTRDVISYLKMRKLPLPAKDGRNASGIDLTQESVLFLHDNFHDDYARLEKAFPFVGAIPKRRALYGIGDSFLGAAASV